MNLVRFLAASTFFRPNPPSVLYMSQSITESVPILDLAAEWAPSTVTEGYLEKAVEDGYLPH